MIEETQQSENSVQNDSCSVQNDVQINSLDVGKTKDNKKEKCRPMTKVVIRRLPPSMTQDQFLEQVSPLPDHDYLYFVKADMSLGQFAYSRAYINFVEQQDIFMFREKFDNYVFVDSKGMEYPAVVEFAPFQRLPKKRAGKKKDLKCGTIESDSYYISFLESLKNQEIDPSVAQSKTEYSYQPPDNTVKKIMTTPLLEYLKIRKQEKQRLKDEKREERRRRDIERRRTKDDPIVSKHVNSVEGNLSSNFVISRPANVKFEDTFFQCFVENASARKCRKEILFNRFICERAQEKICKTHQRFYEHIKKAKPIRNMFDVKKQYLNGGKQVSCKTYLCFHKGDHVLRNPDLDKESRDDKENKDERDKMPLKELKNRNKRDDKIREKLSRDRETKPIIKGYRERVDDRNKDRDIKQRRYDEKKPYGRRDERDSMREERRNDFKDDRRYEAKEEFRESRDRKMEERRGKSYEKMRQEKKKLAETKKQIADVNGDDTSPKKVKEEQDTAQEREDGGKESVHNDDDSKHAKDNECTQRNTAEDRVTATQDCGDNAEEGIISLSAGANEDDECEEKSKVVKRRSSLESSGEGGAGDGSCLRRHKSLDGGGPSNLQKNEIEEKEKDKKDPRMERRIRNKDRPAMEIYRPGMGKFSKQRLEREKSNNDERASLSQSPTPNAGTSSAPGKPGKPGATEVRSMTFKRSVSRDVA
ncbi:regulator of nonsense transcripts 3B isoform X1 [Linepithema humile]|uniref:regulator of nonsense transcripts 3B isoform X1 n=1 Tax=Linepithema humile TaxID=83485 RepID=UPI00062319EE|nr:PREDICTED: regulator of nonsense transcripts 3A isoform X1 [Linepithema humile]